MAAMSRMRQPQQPPAPHRRRLAPAAAGLAAATGAWALLPGGRADNFVAPTLAGRRPAVAPGSFAPAAAPQPLPATAPTGACAGLWAAGGIALAAGLAAAGERRARRCGQDGRAADTSRRSHHAEAACTEDSETGTLFKKTQCLHPDKPMMFACADCPRRGGKAPMAAVADFNGADVSVAALVGESACSTEGVTSKKTQCLHPDKPMMFACADCPRRGCKAPADAGDVAVAAFLGEQSCSADCVNSKKTQCLHPDKPMMFACADCPRRGCKAPADAGDVAVAAFLGEQSCSADCVNSKKTQCLHPDKPMMFACADCPRRGGKAPANAAADTDGMDVATAAFLGEQSCSVDCVNSKKTQCLHPDKPMMFACADCPRRGCKAPADAGDVAVAAFLGEQSCSADCVNSKKTQCLHPDKPMMFACADCPRRGAKAPADVVAECDGADVAVAAFLGEQACSADCVNSKKTQCLHPDKPMMFACADCPRRGAKAPADVVAECDGADVAVAAFLGEQACSADCVSSKKTQCLHPDKPMMFACSDCPRRGAKAPVATAADLDGIDVAAAAFLGEQTCDAECVNSKKTQCLHPDKPMMFACADCPRRGAKAPADVVADSDGAVVAVAAFLGEQACSADCVNSKKTQCLHPDKPMMFACADCPRRGCKAPADAGDVAVAAFLGEQSCSADCVNSKKTQCLHPDKPMMFACADCPRRGAKAPAAVVADSDGADVAVAAFLGEQDCVNSKKTQCLHPDKPMMFACADCPRRGAKAPAALVADSDGADVAVAALLGEQACSADCVNSKKTQCLHPDKPMMFACADCPRRGAKAPAALVADSDGADVAVAAFLGEQACSADCVNSKKTQCLHPDKPMMFACADCPRRGASCMAGQEAE